MKIKDVLYKQTLVRVGKESMQGIDRLIDDGHHGIAEKHTVGKLIAYVKGLEQKLGIVVPDPDSGKPTKGYMKINTNGVSYFAPMGA